MRTIVKRAKNQKNGNPEKPQRRIRTRHNANAKVALKGKFVNKININIPLVCICTRIQPSPESVTNNMKIFPSVSVILVILVLSVSHRCVVT